MYSAHTVQVFFEYIEFSHKNTFHNIFISSTVAVW